MKPPKPQTLAMPTIVAARENVRVRMKGTGGQVVVAFQHEVKTLVLSPDQALAMGQQLIAYGQQQLKIVAPLPRKG